MNQQEMYACVYIKDFSLQALLRLRPELRRKACVVMTGDPPLEYVYSLNKEARARGVSEAMTRVELDTFPAITALPQSLDEEASARSAAMTAAGIFSPRIEDRSHGNNLLYILDIQGTERLSGKPAQLGSALLEQINLLELHASIAITSNVHTSIAVARGMSSMDQVAFVPPGKERVALSQLPLAVLDLTEANAETFSNWGIHTLGMLAELPEKELISRMGQQGKRMRDLARGEHRHLFRPVESVFQLREHMELDAPVELLDSLLFVIGMMLQQLIVRATAHIFALASVSVLLRLEGGDSHQRTVCPALASNDKAMWLKLIHLDMEAHPPSAAILALTLTAEHGITSKVQLGLFAPQLPEPMRLDITLARIRAIVGEGRVGRAELRDTHRRERYGANLDGDLESFRVEPFSIPTKIKEPPASAMLRIPSRLLRPAEQIPVTLRGRLPERFFFRDTWYAVQNAYGPWLASGDWWSASHWGNEQWDLVASTADGGLLCCCLIHDRVLRNWQLVALYD
jgi:protein ImuB